MERGFEQLFVLAAILLAAMVDLFVRWLRGKTRKDQPSDVAALEEEEEMVLVEEADTELPEQRPVEPQLPPPAPAPKPSPRPSSPATAAPMPSQRPSPPARVRPHRRHRAHRAHRAHRWLKHPIDARRGIVLMAILGPCRGLEAPYRDV